MENISNEILLAVLCSLLIYIFLKKNNSIIFNPNKDQMTNVNYYSDDINDINLNYNDQDVEKSNEKSDVNDID